METYCEYCVDKEGCLECCKDENDIEEHGSDRSIPNLSRFVSKVFVSKVRGVIFG
jgi:hypothetical protein